MKTGTMIALVAAAVAVLITIGADFLAKGRTAA